MATTRTRKRSSSRRPTTSLGKPRGVLHPRVQQVGPEHFGIVCFDCAKARSKFLVADFYGRVLIPPTTVAHARPDLAAAVAQVRAAFAANQIADGLIAIERTGRYHRIVQRTFAAAGFETRILHPFVTKQYRQPVDPGYKTDDTDLSAIHRATVTGCASSKPLVTKPGLHCSCSSVNAAISSAKALPSTAKSATTSMPAYRALPPALMIFGIAPSPGISSNIFLLPSYSARQD